jgi:hypothetical protein
VWYYNHSDAMVSGDGCTIGGSSISGIAFSSGTTYPVDYHGGIFIADYSRNCIVFMPAGAGGLPDPSLLRPFESNAAEPVSLATAPDGDIVYTDFEASDPAGDLGTIHRIRYVSTSASFTITPADGGPLPLAVHFDASASTGGPGDTLTYTWDFDDGSAIVGPLGSATVDHTFTVVGTHHVKLTVTDVSDSSSSSVTHVVQAGVPPSLSIDSPSAGTTWATGDTIHLSASATDPQDGPLPGSAFSWIVVLDHCPPEQACHEHPVTSFTGASGDFPAPDHDYPSHLHIVVTATDSVGLTATQSLDLQPDTTDLIVASNLPGVPVPVAVGSTQGTTPMTGTYIVGGTRDVTAAPVVIVGEQTYAFSSWSNGTLTPTITGYKIPAASPTTLTASYTLIDTDASNTCRGAATQTSLGGWWSGTIGTATDEDWYRFTLKSTATVQITLGDLPVDGRLELWEGCSVAIETSDRSGLSYEEILRSLPAGTYSVRVLGHGAFDPTAHYSLRVRPIGGSTAILSSRTTLIGGDLRIVGEVLDNSRDHRGPIVVTAWMYSKNGTLLGSRQTTVLTPMLQDLGRAPFLLVASPPRGYDHLRLAITSAPVTRASRIMPTWAITASSPQPVGWVVTGTLHNPTTSTMLSVRAYLEVYDGLGDVMSVVHLTPSTTTLRPDATATFAITLRGVTPARVVVDSWAAG